MVQEADFESCSVSIDKDQRTIGTFPDLASCGTDLSLRRGSLTRRSRI
jgi:hypothetical protein